MLARFRRMFGAYLHTHVSLRQAGQALCDARGRQFGQIETMVLQGGTLTLTGWTEAETVSLIAGTQCTPSLPRTRRDDVGGSDPARLGFRIQTLLPGDTPHLRCALGGEVYYVPVPTYSRSLLAPSTLRVAARFGADLTRAAPLVLRWLVSGDRTFRTRARDILALDAPMLNSVPSLDPDLFAPAAPAVVSAPVTVIAPVFNALNLLPEMLDRLRRHTDLPWHLILIEDASSDPGVRPFLRDWVAGDAALAAGRTTLIENAENLGFIASVNKGLAEAAGRDGPVILLNTDAFVPQGWASRLIAPLLADSSLASVTPFSNDAEIFSVPVICARSPLAPGQIDALDAAAQRIGPAAALAEAPTGVGFCMALSRAFLGPEPRFDTSFGRGYGEEVDWCQKVRARGGRHIGLASLFVEHRGGTSFGSAEKLKLVARNNAVIAARYPSYDAEVQDFIRADPLISARLALAVAWAGTLHDDPLPVYLAHALGGGAEDHLKRRLAGDIAARGAALVLRVGGPRRWRIEVHGTGGITLGDTDDVTLIGALLAAVPRCHLIYSCGVGFPDPAQLPGLFLSLRRAGTDRLDILFHDYLPLSASYGLLDATGRLPGLHLPDAAPATGMDGTALDPAGWRAAWGPLLAAADRLIVYSPSSVAIVAQAWPELAGHIVLQPHADVAPVPRLPVSDGPPVIGVLGNIGFQKGAALLTGLGKALDRQQGAGLVILGNVDPAHMPPAPVKVHGDYDIAQLGALVARYCITGWLIPSIWPETFSYTTHEVLATGLPVWCFDLGGQADAVRGAVNGHLLPLALANDPARLAAALLQSVPPHD